uniref:Uncharacterized protein n=1 Tax=Arundo donax TaxID=35708 RepID=A0A0A9ATS2_ARUDO
MKMIVFSQADIRPSVEIEFLQVDADISRLSVEIKSPQAGHFSVSL